MSMNYDLIISDNNNYAFKSKSMKEHYNIFRTKCPAMLYDGSGRNS